MNATKTIAVIGGSGFVGSALADHLGREFKIRVVDVAPPRSDGFEFVRCDIRDKNALRSALDGVDLVIDTAIVQIPTINEDKLRGYEVNVIGMLNACEAARDTESVRGFILASSWHVFGEREFRGVIDEEFGFRPDKIELRARLYALSKIAQEAVVRISDEMSQKVYGIVRLGTVLGENMPRQTAANIFIENALHGKPLTPFKHTMHRPMLYVDILDICRAFGSFSHKILDGKIRKSEDEARVVNVVWPKPITIIELAKIVKSTVRKLSGAKIDPRIKVEDKGVPPIYTVADKLRLKVDISKAKKFLGIDHLTDPRSTMSRIIADRLRKDS